MKILELNEENRNEFVKQLEKRRPISYGTYQQAVDEILENVRNRGDEALFEYTKRFDKCEINAENIRVTKEEIKAAYDELDPALIETMKRSAANIRRFHEKQKRTSFIETGDDGVILGQRVIPMEVSGVYVPGGTAALSSSALMNLIPASVAGVKNIIMCTPPGKDGKVAPGILVAADIAGADAVYKVGGAQAIAAMAYGTKSIPKADKITGPGNIYVALAKRAVFGYVSIDSIAGPSEILVIADGSANARFVAADLLSQAEHDVLASAILITTDRKLAENVQTEIEDFCSKLERADIIRKSLEDYGAIFIAEDIESAAAAANLIASEHVEIQTKDPFEVMTKITNAGAVFLGPWSSEPLGDYFAGPNHILPTNGTARFFSPLSVDDFIKKSSIISYSREALYRAHEDIERFAKSEGLSAHANSIAVRFE